MGWLENAKSLFADGGSFGCFPKIGRKLSKNTYAYPIDPGKFPAPFCGGDWTSVCFRFGL
jgi:hypothetical protein